MEGTMQGDGGWNEEMEGRRRRWQRLGRQRRAMARWRWRRRMAYRARALEVKGEEEVDDARVVSLEGAEQVRRSLASKARVRRRQSVRSSVGEMAISVGVQAAARLGLRVRAPVDGGGAQGDLVGRDRRGAKRGGELGVRERAVAVTVHGTKDGVDVRLRAAQPERADRLAELVAIDLAVAVGVPRAQEVDDAPCRARECLEHEGLQRMTAVDLAIGVGLRIVRGRCRGRGVRRGRRRKEGSERG